MGLVKTENACACTFYKKRTNIINRASFCNFFYSFQQIPKYPKYSLCSSCFEMFPAIVYSNFCNISIFTRNLLLQFLSNIAQNLSVNKKDSSKLFKLVLFYLIAWMYFNIELKSTVAQNENLAARGILGVRVPLWFFFSFCLNKNNPSDFFTDQ